MRLNRLFPLLLLIVTPAAAAAPAVNFEGLAWERAFEAMETHERAVAAHLAERGQPRDLLLAGHLAQSAVDAEGPANHHAARYRQALALAPDDPLILFALAGRYVFGVPDDLAEAALERLLEREYDNLALWLLLAEREASPEPRTLLIEASHTARFESHHAELRDMLRQAFGEVSMAPALQLATRAWLGADGDRKALELRLETASAFAYLPLRPLAEACADAAGAAARTACHSLAQRLAGANDAGAAALAVEMLEATPLAQR